MQSESPFLSSAWSTSYLVKRRSRRPARSRGVYFRARHVDWEFEVADETGALRCDRDEPPVFLRRGKAKNAGYMQPDDAHRIILGCVMEYLRG